MTDGTQEDRPPRRLTATAVGAIIGKDRKRVHEIPSDQLPYTTTRGGNQRGGRRYYRPEDVDAYLRRGDRLTAVEAEVVDLRRRLDEHEKGHD